MPKTLPFRVVCAFDTETTTIGEGGDSRAFAYAYIFNDFSAVDLADYKFDRDDDIKILRHESEAVDEILRIANAANDYVPIVAAYNLMFDLQTLLEDLGKQFDFSCNAQTSTHVYNLDLLDHETGAVCLRFWDTFFLDMSGLASMGETAGVPKAVGDLEYSLVRTPETPLSEREIFYMRRDVQVIPAYLSWLLAAYPWMYSSDLGFKILTKTSIVRQMALHQLYALRTPRRWRLGVLFEQLCSQELPPDFETMALRTACFRGGLTFTAARTAYTTVKRVGSWDVTSMHHQYINGRMIPVKFHKFNAFQLLQLAHSVLATPIEAVLTNYDCPFNVAFHCVFDVSDVQLKAGSAFAAYGIATLAEGKFANRELNSEPDGDDAVSTNEANVAFSNELRDCGWQDTAQGATFAFGKLYSANSARLFMSEVELWNFAQVYDFSSISVVTGEATTSFVRPPDYVTLQSNMLFEQKSHVKHIVNAYEEGKPYTEEIPADIPDSIADGLRAGTITESFMSAYYNVATKGAFNGIYGCQAMQLWRPDFCVESDGEIHIDSTTVPCDENFEERAPKKPRVLYSFGLRIVGGSRQHLVIAIMLIYRRFGMRALVTGGDTDSLKIALAPGIDPADVQTALEPLHDACRRAKARVMLRVRRNFPELASKLEKIGEFDFEPASRAQPFYDEHMELWNKARVSRVGERVHVTLAGVSRPNAPEGFVGCYNIEQVIEELISHGCSFDEAVKACLGYNSTIGPRVGHALQRVRPKPTDVFDGEVKDYYGTTTRVCAHAAQALYPFGKVLGDSTKFTNAASISYMKKTYGRNVDLRDKFVTTTAEGAHARVEIGNADPVILE